MKCSCNTYYILLVTKIMNDWVIFQAPVCILDSKDNEDNKYLSWDPNMYFGNNCSQEILLKIHIFNKTS